MPKHLEINNYFIEKEVNRTPIVSPYHADWPMSTEYGIP